MTVRKDYGPAGCADGCAKRGVQVALIGWALAVLLKPRKERRRV